MQWLPLHLVFDLDACMFEVLHGTSSENFLQTGLTDSACAQLAIDTEVALYPPAG